MKFTKKALQTMWKDAGYDGDPVKLKLTNQEMAQDLIVAHTEELAEGYRMLDSKTIEVLISIKNGR